jgi:hypothetical protein
MKCFSNGADIMTSVVVHAVVEEVIMPESAQQKGGGSRPPAAPDPLFLFNDMKQLQLRFQFFASAMSFNIMPEEKQLNESFLPNRLRNFWQCLQYLSKCSVGCIVDQVTNIVAMHCITSVKLVWIITSFVDIGDSEYTVYNMVPEIYRFEQWWQLSEPTLLVDQKQSGLLPLPEFLLQMCQLEGLDRNLDCQKLVIPENFHYALLYKSQEVPGQCGSLMSKASMLVADKLCGNPPLSKSLFVHMAHGAPIVSNPQLLSQTCEINSCRTSSDHKLYQLDAYESVNLSCSTSAMLKRNIPGNSRILHLVIIDVVSKTLGLQVASRNSTSTLDWFQVAGQIGVSFSSAPFNESVVLFQGILSQFVAGELVQLGYSTEYNLLLMFDRSLVATMVSLRSYSPYCNDQENVSHFNDQKLVMEVIVVHNSAPKDGGLHCQSRIWVGADHVLQSSLNSPHHRLVFGGSSGLSSTACDPVIPEDACQIEILVILDMMPPVSTAYEWLLKYDAADLVKSDRKTSLGSYTVGIPLQLLMTVQLVPFLTKGIENLEHGNNFKQRILWVKHCSVVRSNFLEQLCCVCIAAVPIYVINEQDYEIMKMVPTYERKFDSYTSLILFSYKLNLIQDFMHSYNAPATQDNWAELTTHAADPELHNRLSTTDPSSAMGDLSGTNACSRKWFTWMTLTEFWYIISFHKTIGCCPISALCGYSPGQYSIHDDLCSVEKCVPRIQKHKVLTEFIEEYIHLHHEFHRIGKLPASWGFLLLLHITTLANSSAQSQSLLDYYQLLMLLIMQVVYGLLPCGPWLRLPYSILLLHTAIWDCSARLSFPEAKLGVFCVFHSPGVCLARMGEGALDQVEL